MLLTSLQEMGLHAPLFIYKAESWLMREEWWSQYIGFALNRGAVNRGFIVGKNIKRYEYYCLHIMLYVNELNNLLLWTCLFFNDGYLSELEFILITKSILSINFEYNFNPVDILMKNEIYLNMTTPLVFKSPPPP